MCCSTSNGPNHLGHSFAPKSSSPGPTGGPHLLLLHESKILPQDLKLLHLLKGLKGLPPSPTSWLVCCLPAITLALVPGQALQHSPHKGHSLNVHESPSSSRLALPRPCQPLLRLISLAGEHIALWFTNIQEHLLGTSCH